MDNFGPNLDGLDVDYIILKNEERKVKKSANFIGITFIILMVLPFFLTTMLTNLLRAFGLSSQEAANLLTDPMFLMAAQIFISILIFILPLGIILYSEHLKLTDIVSFKKPKKEFFLPIILMCIGITAFANIITNLLTTLFNIAGLPVSPPDFETPKGVLGFIITLLSVAVTPALVEEFSMRGVVQGSLKRYGKGFAIGVSAILFGMMHGNLSQIPFAFILGIAIGFAVIKTDSIWTGVIIHFINNGVSVVLDAIATKTENLQFIGFVNSLYFILCILAFFVGLYLLKGRTRELLDLGEDKTFTSSLSLRMKWFFGEPTIIISIVVTAIECVLSLFIY
ncbi:MAG: CPBP family intramembrane metalloprotease [Clostridia bacterium]|nr:CPBP family intramembrane metalloprotease [Clostridia bacterium]